MLMVSLIAAQDYLVPEIVQDLHARWSGEERLRYLSHGEAAEFRIEEIPSDFAKVRADLDKTHHIDLNIISSENRIKKVLLADMDSTIIEQECIDELADVIGVGAQVAHITAQAMNGELDFNEALEARVALLSGVSASAITDILNSRISIANGALCLLKTMRARGAHCVLVSGGFTDFSSVVAERVGFHAHYANHLLRQGGSDILNGGVKHPILGRAQKLEILHKVAADKGLTSNDVLTVGDGANDLDMLQNSGLGVALHAKPAVASQCDVSINHGCLTSLLFLQGISRDQFK